MNHTTALLFAFIFIAALGIVGRDDYEQEVLEEKAYCKDVMQGRYVNYRNLKCWEIIRSGK